MSKHSQERIEQRYNLTLTKSDERLILSYINSGKYLSVPIQTDEPAKKRFAYVKFRHIPIKVLYANSTNNNAHAIITAYPLDVDEYNELNELRVKKDIENCIKFLKLNGYIVYKRGEKSGKDNG